MSLVLNDNIYSGIASQFPAIYREEGSFLVDFIQAYYEHLDTKIDRDIPKIKDIDTTLSTFLIFYKKKYLANLPINTADPDGTRFIIKHIMDMYKRKGTQESLELLFRLFFDEDIEVFYPSTAILRPSDSIFSSETYLEMFPVFTIDDYPIQRGDKLAGNVSLASAFVDDIIFVNFSGSLSPIVYLSNVSGKFSIDDSLIRTRAGVSLNIGKLIDGSISEVTVNRLGSSPNQKVGDKVKLESNALGRGATGSVTAVSGVQNGTIKYEIEDGGFGYADPATSSAENIIGISNQVLVLDGTSKYTIKSGDVISAYDANITNSDGTTSSTKMFGSAVVIAYTHPLLFVKTQSTADRAIQLVKTYSESDVQDVQGVTSSDNILTTEIARIVSGDLPIVREVENALEKLIDDNANGTADRLVGDFDDDGSINADAVTAFANYLSFVSTGTQGSLSNTQKQYFEQIALPELGVFQEFTALTTGQKSTFAVNHATGTPVTFTSTSAYNTTSSYTIAAIADTEKVSLIVDEIGDIISALNATDYLMSGSTAESLSTTIKDAFTRLDLTIGSISSVISNSGTGYRNDVFSTVENLNITNYDKKDIIINFDINEVGDIGFVKDDPITQDRTIENVLNVDITTILVSKATGDYSSQPTLTQSSGNTVPYTAKGKFVKRDGNDFYFRQMSFHDFDESLTVKFAGQEIAVQDIRRDPNSKPMGANAVITGKASYDSGQIESIKLDNTGYRYADNETVNVVCDQLGSSSYGNTVSTATLRTLGAGSTEGSWKSTTSFLSDSSRKLHDNDYYQEYSYDISSAVRPGRYTELISQVTGVAGTKLFSSSLVSSIEPLDIELDSVVESFHVKPTVFELADSPAVLGADLTNVTIGSGSTLRHDGANIDASHLIAITGNLTSGTITNYPNNNSGAEIGGVSVSGTAGQFTCSGTVNLVAGQIVRITGTLTGTADIAGGTGIYKVNSVTGTSPSVTGFTLGVINPGNFDNSSFDVALQTVAGTTTGLTFTSGKLYELAATQTSDGVGITAITLDEYDSSDDTGDAVTMVSGSGAGITVTPIQLYQDVFTTGTANEYLIGDVLSANTLTQTRQLSQAELESLYTANKHSDLSGLSHPATGIYNPATTPLTINEPGLIGTYDISDFFNSIVGVTDFSSLAAGNYTDRVELTLSDRKNWIGYDTLSINISNRGSQSIHGFSFEVTDGTTTVTSNTVTPSAYSASNPSAFSTATASLGTTINRNAITKITLIFSASFLSNSGADNLFKWRIWGEGSPIVNSVS